MGYQREKKQWIIPNVERNAKQKSKTPNAEEIPKLNTFTPLSNPKSAHSTPG
jgi:hypothetical protein